MLTYLKLESRIRSVINYECTALTNWATGPNQLTSFYNGFIKRARTFICNHYLVLKNYFKAFILKINIDTQYLLLWESDLYINGQ